MAEPIEWHVLHRSSSRTRWLLATCAGLVVGGGAGVGAAGLVATGGVPPVPLALVLLLVPLAAAAALGAYRRSRERTPLADALAVDAAGVRWLPVAGLVAAGLALAVPWLGQTATAQSGLAVAAAGAVGALLVQTLRGAGRFDPDTGMASVEGRVYDLERCPTTAIPLAGLTVIVVRRPVPNPLERYGLLAMPTAAYREAALQTAGRGL